MQCCALPLGWGHWQPLHSQMRRGCWDNILAEVSQHIASDVWCEGWQSVHSWCPACRLPPAWETRSPGICNERFFCNRMNMCMRTFRMFWDGLMMDVSHKRERCITFHTQRFWELITYIKLSFHLGFGARDKTSCHWLNCISGMSGVTQQELNHSKAQRQGLVFQVSKKKQEIKMSKSAVSSLQIAPQGCGAPCFRGTWKQ